MRVLSRHRDGMLLLVFSLIASHCMAAQDASSPDRQTYDQKIRQTYDFAFGPGKMSTPGNAAPEGGGFISPTAFPTAEYCSRCHQRHITSGGSRCTRIPSALLFIGRA